MICSIATQVVAAYASARTAGFDDDRDAVTALEAKKRLDGEVSIQNLHDQLANLRVTVADI